MCAAWIDADVLAPQRCVYVEHGAGQTYLDGSQGDGRGYAGGAGLEHVVLFLAPGEPVATRWRARYPQTPVETVGCPALDQHFHARRISVVCQSYDWGAEDGPAVDGGCALHGLRTGGVPVVAVTEHWRCGTVPETLPAMPLFDRAIAEISRAGEVHLIGHAHPRGARRTIERWRRLGITTIERDPDALLCALRTAQSAVLVADNTSLMYEAAALDIPVLAVNGPDYRRGVEHGLRFWSHVPGIQCDSVGTFIPAVMAALDDPPEARALRAHASAHVYAHADGDSAARAADAIERVI